MIYSQFLRRSIAERHLWPGGRQPNFGRSALLSLGLLLGAAQARAATLYRAQANADGAASEIGAVVGEGGELTFPTRLTYQVEGLREALARENLTDANTEVKNLRLSMDATDGTVPFLMRNPDLNVLVSLRFRDAIPREMANFFTETYQANTMRPEDIIREIDRYFTEFVQVDAAGLALFEDGLSAEDFQKLVKNPDDQYVLTPHSATVLYLIAIQESKLPAYLIRTDGRVYVVIPGRADNESDVIPIVRSFNSVVPTPEEDGKGDTGNDTGEAVDETEDGADPGWVKIVLWVVWYAMVAAVVLGIPAVLLFRTFRDPSRDAGDRGRRSSPARTPAGVGSSATQSGIQMPASVARLVPEAPLVPIPGAQHIDAADRRMLDARTEVIAADGAPDAPALLSPETTDERARQAAETAYPALPQRLQDQVNNVRAGLSRYLTFCSGKIIDCGKRINEHQIVRGGLDLQRLQRNFDILCTCADLIEPLVTRAIAGILKHPQEAVVLYRQVQKIAGDHAADTADGQAESLHQMDALTLVELTKYTLAMLVAKLSNPAEDLADVGTLKTLWELCPGKDIDEREGFFENLLSALEPPTVELKSEP